MFCKPQRRRAQLVARANFVMHPFAMINKWKPAEKMRDRSAAQRKLSTSF